jgi:hypothetical protein
MNTIRFTLFISCLWLATITCMWAQAPAKHRLIEFDAPGAGGGPSQGTIGAYISADASITGWFTDSNNLVHGFLRNPDGTFVAFDPVRSAATYPQGMNQAHTIVGQYSDAQGVLHGFARNGGGKIVSYNAPGSGTGSGQGTTFGAINKSGEILGSYIDSNSALHGFLLTPNGTFTPFDAPGAGTGPFQGTVPATADGLTDEGAVGGTVFGSDGFAHGFLRARDGTFSEFDATSDNLATLVFGVNSQQTLAGLYFELSGAEGGFVRTADGTITDIPVPIPPNGTVSLGVNAINALGAVVGYYSNSNLISWQAARGYERASDGEKVYFKAPDAGTGPNQGTFPYDNNDSGQITGTYIDSAGAYHGFIVE